MIELLNCDCMDYMKTLEDNAFDLAIVDPPYRDLNQPTRTMRLAGSMDSIVGRPDQLFFSQIKRVCKNWIIWGANNFLIKFEGFISWRKINIPDNFTMSQVEIAALSKDLGTTSKEIRLSSLDYNRIHPNQKPVKLYDWLLKNYAKEGDKILDTHLGSGSSAIAAHYAGYDFVGCELDKDYFEAAKKRFDEETRQKELCL